MEHQVAKLELSHRTLLQLFAANSGNDLPNPHAPPNGPSVAELVAVNALNHGSASLAIVVDLLVEREQYSDSVPTSVTNSICHLRDQLAAAAVIVGKLGCHQSRPRKTWEATDFHASIRDCFKHFEAIQSMSLSAVKDSEQGDFMPHVVALGAFLAELRDRLATEIVWDEKQESEAAE